jgi:hypothetical protein
MKKKYRMLFSGVSFVLGSSLLSAEIEGLPEQDITSNQETVAVVEEADIEAKKQYEFLFTVPQLFQETKIIKDFEPLSVFEKRRIETLDLLLQKLSVYASKSEEEELSFWKTKVALELAVAYGEGIKAEDDKVTAYVDVVGTILKNQTQSKELAKIRSDFFKEKTLFQLGIGTKTEDEILQEFRNDACSYRVNLIPGTEESDIKIKEYDLLEQMGQVPQAPSIEWKTVEDAEIEEDSDVDLESEEI